VLVLPEVEDKVWPFVVSVIPPEPSVPFFDRYFKKQRELLDRREHWVHVVDCRLVAKLPDATVRHAVAQHSKAIEGLSAQYNIGTATVIKSSAVRGILTAIHWLMPPPHPFACVGTPTEGLDFLRTCLARRNLLSPARMTADLVELVTQRVTARDPQRNVY
jgi:hypothetical protein